MHHTQRRLDVLRLRLRSLFKRQQLEAELQRELQAHIEHLTQENIASGVSPTDARYAALRAFGNVSVTKEEVRDTRGTTTVENLLKDMRYTLRALLREPMLLLAATTSIALGAGGNIAIFSLARELLFTAPDVRDPETLVQMRVSHGSHATYQRWRDLDASGAMGRIAGFSFEDQVNWFNGDAAVSITPMVVTANFFDVTGVPFSLGRPFSEAEARAELEPRLAVLTHAFWQQNFNADSGIVGRTILFDGEPYTITGVLAPRLRSVAGFALSPTVYLSLNRSNTPAMLRADDQIVELIGRLKRNQSLQDGRKAIDAIDRRLGRLAGDTLYAGVQEFARVGALGGGKAADKVGLFFVMLVIVALLVLLIACANVAGLLVARATAKRRETAIRLAIGGTRRRLLQQFLVEGFWLALIGTAAGLGLSTLFMGVVNRIALPVQPPIELNLTTDVPVLICAVGIVVLSMLFCSLLPALGATRRSVTPALKLEEPRHVHRKVTMRSLLLAGQVTFSTLLLVTALLFVRNLARSQLDSPGFEVDRTMSVQLGFANRQAAADNVRLLQRAIERAQAIPGVESAAYSSVIPLSMHSGSSNGGNAFIGSSTSARHIEYNRAQVGPGYFGTMGIRLVRGREFTAADRAGAQAVAIVNEEFARRYFEGQTPIGNRIRSDAGGRGWDVEVVGVAANSKYWTLGEHQRAALYFPVDQFTGSLDLAFVVLRSRADPPTLVNTVRQTLGEIDRSVSVEVKPMRETLAFALLPSQAGAAILGSLGTLGLILAAFGLYAIVACNVSRRVSEIAIRSALGATRAKILRLVVRDVAAVVGIGLTLGLGIAMIATKPLEAFLVASLSTKDPLSFVGTALVFGLVSVLAGWLPARSATRVSPVVAMRAE